MTPRLNVNNPTHCRMIEQLISEFSQPGRLLWIGLRSERRSAMVAPTEVYAGVDIGLQGDRYQGKSRKRQVTLIQSEHLSVISSFVGVTIDPAQLRRNLLIEGINLLALKNQSFRIGEAVFTGTGSCHPCSRMTEALGEGGYNAMRGHGGITACVLEPGLLRLGDEISPISNYEEM